MLLNRFEKLLMNNPVRALIQRHVEARRLMRMGGPVTGGAALEIGCGRGIGIGLAFDVFGAHTVDAFDLDSRMVALAAKRVAARGSRTRLWVGDATEIPSPDAAYDAVFDYGVLHHVPCWRDAVAEVGRVLRPCGRLYGEEMLAKFILHPHVQRCFHHPIKDRFNGSSLRAALEEVGLRVTSWTNVHDCFAWFVAAKGPGGGPSDLSLGAMQ
jgi:ubiquinone/menaquinone biosynthesis C-methylase UbiE